MSRNMEAARAACRRARSIAERSRAVDAELAEALREIADEEHWKTLGYDSLGTFAERELDISPGKAKELVALSKRLDALPKVRAAFAAGVVSWTKCRQIARIATRDTEDEWLDEAKESTNRDLERTVAEVKGEPPRRRFTIEVTEEQYAAYERGMRRIREDYGALALTPGEVLAIMAERCSAPPVEKPAHTIVIHECPTCAAMSRDTREGPIPASETTVAVARSDAEIIDLRDPEKPRQHEIPPALRAKVIARDGNRCRCCGAPCWQHVHHLVPGRNEIDLLLLLCSTCHLRRLHTGDLMIESLGGGAFEFRLRDGSLAPVLRRPA